MFNSSLHAKNPEVIRFLENAIKQNRLANSYIFNTRNTEVALEIARHLALIKNCVKTPNDSPCLKCLNCNWILENKHPQAFKVIVGESKKEQVKIDSIRELLLDISLLSPYFRVIVFQNASQVTDECCNLLLKTVEESPEKTIFIFIASSTLEIQPTIQSRSQTLFIKNNFILNDSTVQPPPISNLKNPFGQAKIYLKFIEENKISMKDFLISLLEERYKNKKDDFHLYYKEVNLAFQKHKAFIQNKIVLEDLMLLI